MKAPSARRQRIGADAPIGVPLRNEHGSDLRVEILREIPDDVVCQALEREIALHHAAQSELAGAQHDSLLRALKSRDAMAAATADQEQKHQGIRRM